LAGVATLVPPNFWTTIDTKNAAFRELAPEP
jgi:hypothetical protein